MSEGTAEGKPGFPPNPILDSRVDLERRSINQKIEVGCTPAGDTPPSLLVSVPVYYIEWRNGNFLRHIEGHLHQRLSGSDSLEVNYILNYRGERNSETPAYKITLQMRDFLRTLTRLQTLQKNSSKVSGDEQTKIQEEINSLLENEEDNNRKKLLELAVQKADSVQFSFVDISALTPEELTKLGYPEGDKLLGTMRTFGSDYARKRLQHSPNSVFQISDCDTLPSSNTAYEQLITYYRDNPDVPYQFTGLAYQIPGRDTHTFSKAFYELIFRTSGYNSSLLHGSPQISVRASLLNDNGLESVRTILSSHISRTTVESMAEDYATGKRLRALQEENFFTNLYPQFIFLTQIRPDGASDGAEDVDYLVTEDTINRYCTRRDNLLTTMITNEPTIQNDIDSAMQKYGKELEKLRRFVRWGAKEFVKELEIGNIQIVDGTLQYEPTNIKSRALQLYLEQNMKLFTKLTQDDINYLKYLLSLRPEPSVTELNQFQRSMREYFGEAESLETVRSLVLEKRDVNYKGSRMYALFADALAVGEVYRRKFAQNEAWNGPTNSPIPNGYKAIYRGIGPDEITKLLNSRSQMLPYNIRTSWLENVT